MWGDVFILLVFCALLFSAGFFYLKWQRQKKKAETLMRQLQEARRQEALATLAGGIAHDFNNILASVMGFAALLDEDLTAQPEVQRWARQIRIAAKRGQGIVGQLMTYSRHGAETEKAGYTPVSLDAVVREGVDLLRPSIRSSSRLTYTSSAINDLISGDSTQICQALVNLCINADHAIGVRAGVIDVRLDNLTTEREEGGEHVVIEKAAAEQLRAVNGRIHPGKYARISVTDNGEGMTKDILARIFDPFFTTKQVGQGTGLGLAAIQGIVQSHGGGIIVTTARFKGTRFELLFPLNPTAEASRA